MSNVWWAQHRVLMEQLEELAGQLLNEAPIEPAVLKDRTTRLLAGIIKLLRQHDINKRGQCQICARPRIWQLWRRRPQCTVYRSLDFAMRQPLSLVLSLLFQCSPDP